MMDCNGGSRGFTTPQEDGHKLRFFEEMCIVRNADIGPWAIAGDFNLIYSAADKNNPNVDHAMMERFQRILNELELREIELLGRRFT